MSKINDRATVDLFVNGEQAEQTMDRLRKKAKELEIAVSEAQAAGDPKKATSIQRELDKVVTQLNRTESAAKGVGDVLSHLDNTSIHGLRNTLKYLQRELKMSRPDSEAWHRYARQIREVQTRIEELNAELEGSQSAWARYKSWAFDVWPAIDLISKGYNATLDTLHKYVDAYADMDQEMANVRKFTGMTEGEVNSLNDAFRKIDTRSSREQLNKLAQEAGRLGKATEEDVLGFVRGADKINVALDDLGSGATLTLSKLTGIFGVEKIYGTEKSLLKVGSVINELSQNCSASAPYLTNFAERMGGVGAQAGLTIQQIMGFGAVLDSNAQKVEASATALSQIIVRLYQDPAKYARVAGLEVESFSKLMREDANSAVILFLETLQRAGGMDTLSPMFKDMGENGSRAIAALSTLATHIDQVKAQQEAANIAFAEGISIDKEFAVQNETVQARIDKAKKAAQEMRVELGERLQPVAAHMYSSQAAFSRALLITLDYLSDHKTAIITTAVAIGTYTTAIKASAIWTERAAIKTLLLDKAHKTLAVSSKGLSAVMALLNLGAVAARNSFDYLRNGLERTYTMQERWRKATAAINFNAIALAFTAVAAAAYLVYTRFLQASKASKALKDAQKEANAAVAEQLSLVDQLQKKIHDSNLSNYERAKAINELKEIIPGYNAMLSEEGRILEENTKAVDNYIKKLNDQALMKAAQNRLTSLYEEQLNLKMQQPGKKSWKYVAGLAGTQFATGNFGGAVGSIIGAMGGNEFQEWSHNKDLKENSEAIDKLSSLISSLGGVASDGKGSAAVLSEKFSSALYNDDKSGKEYKAAVDIVMGSMKSLRVAADGSASFMNPDGSVSRFDSQEKAIDILNTRLLAVNDKFREAITIAEKTISNSSPGYTPENSTSSSGSDDRFASEKAWRDREEAKARIAYSQGESSYYEHTVRMDSIATEYYQKLLDREDVSGDERLKILAEYWEAVNKSTVTGNKMIIDTETKNYAQLLASLRHNHAERLSLENLSADDRRREAEYYAEILELAELDHLSTMLTLYQEGSDEWLSAQKTFEEKQIAAQERRLKRAETLEKEYNDVKTKYFGSNEKERQADYDKAYQTLQTVYNREVTAAGDSADEKLRIEQAYLKARLALLIQYGFATEEQIKQYNAMVADKSDLPPFAQWLQEDGGRALTGTLQTLTSGMSSIASGLSSMVSAELDIQTAKIENRYDREVQLAQGNAYKVAKLEKKKEAEIAKAKNEANRKLFAMQVIQAVAQTAQNALSAYGSAAAIPVVGYILAPIAAAMAVAAGAIQIAAIKKQQQASEAQGYSKGGFTRPGGVDEPAGIVHAGEWVASQKLLASPVARPMIEALDYVQRTNTIGSLRPEDVSRSITANNSLVRIAESDGGSVVMAAAAAQMTRSVDNLNKRLDEPFVTVNTVTGDAGTRRAQDDYNRMMNNVTPKSRRKKTRYPK